MIVRMKEIVLFTTAKNVDATIQQLGELGVVDITQINSPANGVLERCSNDIENTQKALLLLEAQSLNKENVSDTTNPNGKDPKRIVERLLKFENVKQKIHQAIADVEAQLEFYEIWGRDFKKKNLQELQQKGIYVRLYLLDKPQLKQLPANNTIVTLPKKKGQTPVILFTRNPSEYLNFKEASLPKMPLKSLEALKNRKERQLAQAEDFLKHQKHFEPVLKTYLKILNGRLNSQTALNGMGDIEGKVKYLKGYLPKNTVNEFTTVARAKGWGYAITEPKHIDEVPVYIKNPKWISIINPMMKFIDIVPGYKEIDVSVYFLVAFALFFAMLVGDAGYGLIFLVLALVFRKKMAPQLRALIYVLSTATIIWGVLSGTYFGAEQIAQLPFLSTLVISNIASFGVDNIQFMMHLSFLIGAIHLTVAHAVRAIQFINSIKALSEVGWIALVWGLFFITEELVLGFAAPGWYRLLFAVGASLVILFSKESDSFLKSMAASIANLPLSLISGFSDIVSYVRLFAVGMATAAVAASFNNMALPDGIVGLGALDILLAAIALLLGHTLNIALALMAVMVHGIRLNMLEFAGHLGVQFSGEAYKPFQIETSNSVDNE